MTNGNNGPTHLLVELHFCLTFLTMSELKHKIYNSFWLARLLASRLTRAYIHRSVKYQPICSNMEPAKGVGGSL
jgi:hypothetical protein